MQKSKKENIWLQSSKMAGLALTIGILLSISTEGLINDKSGLLVVILVAVSIVFLGVFFDMIGSAVLIAQEQPFHSMNAKKIGGAAQSIWLIRNAAKVATFCNDIVGDIAGTLGGVACATLSVLAAGFYPEYTGIFKVVIPSLIAALTIGGKSVMKQYAIDHWFVIVRNVGLFFYFAEKRTGLKIMHSERKRRKRVS